MDDMGKDMGRSEEVHANLEIICKSNFWLSKECLREAKLKVFKWGGQDSIALSYQAAGYAMRALLAKTGYVSANHEDAIEIFTEKYIESGQFPKEWLTQIRQMKEHAEMDPTEAIFNLGKENAVAKIKEAEAIKESIEIYIEKYGDDITYVYKEALSESELEFYNEHWDDKY